MARERKPIELRAVEESPVQDHDIVRLGVDPKALRVIPERVEVRPPADARLELGEDPRRSHEPGVDTLIEAELAGRPLEEPRWIEEVRVRPAVPWGWFALLGLALSGAIGWSLNHVIQADRGVKEVHQMVSKNVAGIEAGDREIAHSIEVMERTVRKFCEARSIAELLPLVRHPERVRPLMEKFYAETPLEPLGFQKIKDFQGAPMGTSNSFWVFKVVLGSGRSRPLLVEEEKGSPRVDWETAVTYQPMDWDRYAEMRPKGTTMDFRVKVEMDHFFSHEFADAGQWSSFRLTTPKGAETLFGYAAKGGAVDTLLRETLKNNAEQPVSVVLRLGLPPGLLSRRGVIIEKVLSTRWIYVVPPED